MSYYSGSSMGCKVYVGGLTQSTSKDDLEMAFERYGRLRSVFVARNPPGFAFIEYEDPQDANDAVRALDGRLICGVRARVEISHGKSRAKDRYGGRDSYRGDRRVDSYRRSRERRPRSRSFDRRRDSYSRSSSRGRGVNGRDRKASERDLRRRGSRSRSRS